MGFLAILSQADATFLAAFVVGIPAVIGAVSSYRNGKQLRPNGGSSAKDQLNRIENDVKALHGRVDQLEEAFTNPPANGHIVRRKDIA